MATKDRKCNLIIDSCCDLPADLVESYGVEVMPFTYVMDDGEHVDDLWTSMKPHDFYERMRKGEHSSTSQVPTITIRKTLERAAKNGVPTVFICFSSCLSGTFENIVHTWDDMKKDYPNFEMYIVDSKLASAAEGLLVMEAVRQCDRGLEAAELAEWVREARYYVHGYFTLDGLETLRRGGRIPDMAAVAGAKLDIKPILTFDIDGRLSFFGAARGRKKSIKQLIQILEDRFEGHSQSQLIVAGADVGKEQRALSEHILKLPKEISMWQTSIGPVIGSHVGPGMIALCFWGPDRRENMLLTDRIAKAVSGFRRGGGDKDKGDKADKAQADKGSKAGKGNEADKIDKVITPKNAKATMSAKD